MQEIEKLDNISSLPLTCDQEILDKCIGDDEEKQEQWKQICYIYESLQVSGKEVWPFLKEADVKDLLSKKSNQKVKLTFAFFHDRAKKDFKDKAMKKGNVIKGKIEKAKIESEKESENHLFYRLGGNCITLRVYNQTMDNFFNHMAARELANEWSQPLVIDLSWFSKMDNQARKSFLSEFSYAYSHNRTCPDPMQLTLTSLQGEVKTWFDNMKGFESLMINTTEKPFYEAFPKDKLVYLTPDAKNEVVYDPEDIYVIGGLVDKPILPRASLSLAKNHGIRYGHLPTRKYVG